MAGEDVPAGTPVSYSRQYRRCGKAGCLVCGPGGPGHGPYWYAYWREGGRTRSRYLGRLAPGVDAAQALPQGVPDPPPRAGLRVRALGGFTAWVGDQEVPAERWSRPTSSALFKAPLSAPGHRLGRDHAIELLWPEAAPEQGAARLQTAVHRLRQALGEHGAHLLTYRDEVLALDAGNAPDWLDADTFEAEARVALAGHDAPAYRAALARYTGDYLPGDPYADWAVGRREELRGLRIALLLHLAALATRTGLVEEAEGCLRAVLRPTPAGRRQGARSVGPRRGGIGG